MSVGGGQNIHLSRTTPDLLDPQRCTGTIECALTGLADEVLLLAWLALLLVTAIASLAFLPRAMELVETERERSKSEYDGFDRFIAEVQGVSASPGGTSAELASSGPIMQRYVAPEGSGAEKVSQAYRQTVMDVPHFEEDYGETIREHMRAELSDEIAHATLGGVDFGPHVKRSVLEAARDARNRRADFLDLLDEEHSSLEQHTERLSELERRVEAETTQLCADQTFDELHARLDTLTDCREELETIIDRRQSDRTEGRNAILRLNKDLDLQEYLYAPMDVTYPVFAEAARLLSQIETATRRIEDELIYRA